MNRYFWAVVLEKTLESPLDSKKIQPVSPKGDQSWVFIGRTDVEAETPRLLPPDVKSWLIWKDPDAGKDWGQEEKGMTGWDGWMASPTQWMWVWVNSGNWLTGRPCVLQSMGSQRVTLNWLNWTELMHHICYFFLVFIWILRYSWKILIHMQILKKVCHNFPVYLCCSYLSFNPNS